MLYTVGLYTIRMSQGRFEIKIKKAYEEGMTEYIEGLHDELNRHFSENEWPLLEGLRLYHLLNYTTPTAMIAIRAAKPKTYIEAYWAALEHEARSQIGFIKWSKSLEIKRMLGDLNQDKYE